MLIIGKEDEMIKLSEMREMFKKVTSELKILRIIEGSHAADRSMGIVTQAVNFARRTLKHSNIEKNENEINWDKNYMKMSDIKNFDLRSANPFYNKTKEEMDTLRLSAIKTEQSVQIETTSDINFSKLAKEIIPVITPSQLDNFDDISIGGLDFDFGGGNFDIRSRGRSKSRRNRNRGKVGKSPLLGGKRVQSRGRNFGVDVRQLRVYSRGKSSGLRRKKSEKDEFLGVSLPKYGFNPLTEIKGKSDGDWDGEGIGGRELKFYSNNGDFGGFGSNVKLEVNKGPEKKLGRRKEREEKKVLGIDDFDDFHDDDFDDI